MIFYERLGRRAIKFSRSQVQIHQFGVVEKSYANSDHVLAILGLPFQAWAFVVNKILIHNGIMHKTELFMEHFCRLHTLSFVYEMVWTPEELSIKIFFVSGQALEGQEVGVKQVGFNPRMEAPS